MGAWVAAALVTLLGVAVAVECNWPGEYSADCPNGENTVDKLHLDGPSQLALVLLHDQSVHAFKWTAVPTEDATAPFLQLSPLEGDADSVCGDAVAKILYQWDEKCTQFTLTEAQDDCYPRKASYLNCLFRRIPDMPPSGPCMPEPVEPPQEPYAITPQEIPVRTVTKRPDDLTSVPIEETAKAPACKFDPGTYLRLNGNPQELPWRFDSVEFNPDGFAHFHTEDGREILAWWHAVGEHKVELRDVNWDDVCKNATGQYELSFSPDCNTVYVEGVSDCPPRYKALHDAQLQRVLTIHGNPNQHAEDPYFTRPHVDYGSNWTPTHEDACYAKKDCLTCTADDGCVWCPEEQRCWAGGTMGPFRGRCTIFDYKFCTGAACKAYKNCERCTADPYCGWCVTEGHALCTEGSEVGPLHTRGHTCASWIFDAVCPK